MRTCKQNLVERSLPMMHPCSKNNKETIKQKKYTKEMKYILDYTNTSQILLHIVCDLVVIVGLSRTVLVDLWSACRSI